MALCVLGLWMLLGDTPSPGSIATSHPAPTVKRGRPSARPAASVPAQQAVPLPRDEVKPEGALAVEVLAGDSPVPGAQVQLYWREIQASPASPPPWSLVDGGDTNESGHWEAAARPGSYFISARAEGFATGTLGVLHPPGGERTTVRLRLEAKVGLLGNTMVWGTGDPVSFAEILLTPLAFPPSMPDHLDAPEEELLSTTSNEAGEFSFTGLAPGRYRAVARAAGFARKVLPSVPVPFGARVTIALAPGGRIEGVVIGVNGQPVAGAEVLALSSSHNVTGSTRCAGRLRSRAAGGPVLRVGPAWVRSRSAGAPGHRRRGADGARATAAAWRGSSDLRPGLWEDGTAVLGARVNGPHRQIPSPPRRGENGREWSLLPAIARSGHL